MGLTGFLCLVLFQTVCPVLFFIPCSVPILASNWPTTMKDRHVFHIWHHRRYVSEAWRHWWRFSRPRATCCEALIWLAGIIKFRCWWPVPIFPWMDKDNSCVISLSCLHSAWRFFFSWHQLNVDCFILASVPTRINTRSRHVDRWRHPWRYNSESDRSVLVNSQSTQCQRVSHNNSNTSLTI